MDTIPSPLKAWGIPSDEVLHVPVRVAVYFDGAHHRVTSGSGGTPVILYVTGASIPRVGTESDACILRQMLSRGFVVVTADYQNHPAACPPALDWSAQRLRAHLTDGCWFSDLPQFPKEKYTETFVVPSGYAVSLNHVFWSIDRHGADGTPEKIAEIWNNDFRGVHGERIIRWATVAGQRKETQCAFDGSAPVWLDPDGTPNPTGTHIRIKYTKARTVSDCVKPDGAPLDLNLYMHLIYPVRPAHRVPVMCLANSAANMADCAANPERPQLNGAVFRGYAGVIYDYGYTPMARGDHYGYFDGNQPDTGSITGDNVTYSVQFYNDKKINTAAMRYIRYLALSNPEFCFDPNAIGVFGNSKGGWMTFLGQPHPECFPEARFLPGHHGESRFENGKTHAQGTIRGGEPQPWQTYDGDPIASDANLIYAGCGGAEDFIAEGHCPMYISGNMKDRSYFRRANSFVNLCRIYDIPSVYLVMDIGHTLAHGKDITHGVDSYEAFFRFADFYLNNGNLDILYTCPANGNPVISPDSAITVKFIGAVRRSEIQKIAVSDHTGKLIPGKWSSACGDTEWTFLPDPFLHGGTEVRMDLPADLCGCTGTRLRAPIRLRFRTPTAETAILPVNLRITTDPCTPIRIPIRSAARMRLHVSGNASNVLQISANKTRLGELCVGGAGVYEWAFPTDMPQDASTLALSVAKVPAEISVLSVPFAHDLGGGQAGRWMQSCFAPAPDGTPAWQISAVTLNRRFRNDLFYTNTELYDADSVVYESAPFIHGLCRHDLGRTFRIRVRIYDTVSRKMKVELNSCINEEAHTPDVRRNVYNIQTVADQWLDFAFDYTVYEPGLVSEGVWDKRVILKSESTGNRPAPFYLADLCVTERITDVSVDRIAFLAPSHA